MSQSTHDGPSTDDGPAVAATVHRPAVEALDPASRTALAALWSGAARSGRDDVPVLAELAVLLTALGAPLALAGRAAACAAEQSASAGEALRLAEHYRGGPLDLPAPAGLLGRVPGGVRRPRPALRRLAVRALRDGCLVGGHVAQVTCWAAATATDPGARAALSVVSAAEARAAALWTDVLTWALGERPRLVRRLEQVDLADTSPLAAAVRGAGGDPVALAAHGWPRAEEVDRMWAVHRAGVAARVGAL